MRKEPFVNGEIFHLFNKSIAGFGIFRDFKNSQRFIETLDYYNTALVPQSFSKSLRDKKYRYQNLLQPKENSLVKFISFCIMPDHYHLLIKILKDFSLSKFINDVENSFTRYFNINFDRKGPLWQTSFKAVRIDSNELLLHVSRYIHLNPVTSFLIEKPEDWQFSSYRDFITNSQFLGKIVKEITISNPLEYKKFVENQKNYQRKLKMIRKLILE